MNITEFAQYAGVSKAAVSRYFNGGYLGAPQYAGTDAPHPPHPAGGRDPAQAFQ